MDRPAPTPASKPVRVPTLADAPKAKRLAQQETDFTFEGSSPPGKAAPSVPASTDKTLTAVSRAPASQPGAQKVPATARRPLRMLAALLAASTGAIGRSMAQQDLRNILAYLDASALSQPQAFIHANEGLFDEAGDIGEGNKKLPQSWVDQYVAWM